MMMRGSSTKNIAAIDYNKHQAEFPLFHPKQGNNGPSSSSPAKPLKVSGSNNFPGNLHRLISNSQYEHMITWMPHGRTWKILDRNLLMEEAYPAYFVPTKFESFTRQLSRWGFKRLYQAGADSGCFYHENFQRDQPQLTKLIKREPSHLKPNLHVTAEPNFYNVSRSGPLPPKISVFDDEKCLFTSIDAKSSKATSLSATKHVVQQEQDAYLPMLPSSMAMTQHEQMTMKMTSVRDHGFMSSAATNVSASNALDFQPDDELITRISAEAANTVSSQKNSSGYKGLLLQPTADHTAMHSESVCSPDDDWTSYHKIVSSCIPQYYFCDGSNYNCITPQQGPLTPVHLEPGFDEVQESYEGEETFEEDMNAFLNAVLF